MTDRKRRRIEDPDPDPNAAFRDFAAKGDLEGMRTLYGNPRLNIFTSGAWEAAHQNGHTHIIEELLIRAIDIAVKKGDVDVVQTLVAEPHAKVTFTSLSDAIQLNRADIVRTLLTCHVVDMHFALLRDAFEGGNIVIISMLLDHLGLTGGSVGYVKEASKHGNIDVVELVLNHPSVKRIPDAGLQTFKGALEGSHVDLVRHLLVNRDRFGIDLDQISDTVGHLLHGLTLSSPMLDVLEEYIRTPLGRKKILEDAVFHNKMEMVRRLLATDPPRQGDVFHAWKIAAKRGNVEVAREIMSKYDVSQWQHRLYTQTYPESFKDMVHLNLILFDKDIEKVRELAMAITDPLDVLPSLKFLASDEYADEKCAKVVEVLLERFVGKDALSPDSITPRSPHIQPVWETYVQWSILRSAWIGSMIRGLETK
jgi:hypothetical protein